MSEKEQMRLIVEHTRDGDRLMFRGRSFDSIGTAAALNFLPKFSNRRPGDGN